MEKELVFLPAPKEIRYLEGDYGLPVEGLIWLENGVPQTMMKSSTRFEAILWKQLGYNWETTAGRLSEDMASLRLRIDPERIQHEQGYQLTIDSQGIRVIAHDEAGVFYGVATLVQIMQQSGSQLPCLEIVDWPDFKARGVMLDISRDKVYRMETLYDLVDRLASWKINQLQLYTEHTFTYRFHPNVWKDASPMTGEEILYLDHFCRDRYIELVPNQNSFGHLTRWLKLPEYAHLAEVTGEFDAPWGKMEGPFSLAPEAPGVMEFIGGLYDELLPHFSSSMVNVGCDETFDLGAGKSKDICAERGTGQVYLDYLLRLYHNLKQRGKRMQFWGDIILQHPELVANLPQDLIALEWGYEADHPFDEHGAQFSASGIPFYVCPGTSAWNTIAGRTENCLMNLYNAARFGLQNGAIGYLNTDWGDNGHWQVLPVSFLGFAMGGAYSWSVDKSFGIDVKEAISRFAFEDPTGSMGQIVYEMGNVYRLAGFEISNASALFALMQMSLDDIADHPRMDTQALVNCLEKITEIMAYFRDERMARSDASLIREELNLTAHMLRHACMRGLFAAKHPDAPQGSYLLTDIREIIEDYRTIWLKRNRPGGLSDSADRLDKLAKEYLGLT